MEITVRTAKSTDLSKVVELILDAYNVRGYSPIPGAIEQYLKNDNALVLIAQRANEIVGTMSILFDTGKIPTDEVFPTETAEVRKASRQVAFLGSFAVRKEEWKTGMLSIGFALICEVIARASNYDANTAVIVVNPRHVRFYSNMLGFKKVAYCDNMPGLEKAPAVMMVLDSSGIQNLLARAPARSRLQHASTNPS